MQPRESERRRLSVVEGAERGSFVSPVDCNVDDVLDMVFMLVTGILLVELELRVCKKVLAEAAMVS